MRMVKHWNKLLREVVEPPILGEMQTWTGYRLEQPALGGPA